AVSSLSLYAVPTRRSSDLLGFLRVPGAPSVHAPTNRRYHIPNHQSKAFRQSHAPAPHFRTSQPMLPRPCSYPTALALLPSRSAARGELVRREGSSALDR